MNARTAAAGAPVSLASRRRLSESQRPVWASQLRHPDAPHQNAALLFHIDAPVDAERLRDSFATVVAAHDVLRTRLSITDPDVVRVAESVEPSEIIEMSRADTGPWARRRAGRPLNLDLAGYDSVIICHEDSTVSWYLNLHHVITDATSSIKVFERSVEAYHGTPAAASTYYRPSPADSEVAEAATGPQDPPARMYRSIDPTTAASERRIITPDPGLIDKIERALGAEYRALTPHLAWTTLLVTTAALFYHRVSGASDFSIGMTVHRRRGEDRDSIGPRVAVHPVEIAIRDGDTHRAMHGRVATAVLQALRADRSEPRDDHVAIVNVIPEATAPSFGSARVTTTWIDPGAIDPQHRFRLQLVGYDRSDSNPRAQPWDLIVDIHEGSADAAHRQRAGQHLMSVLKSIVEDPDAAIGSRSLITTDERLEIASWESGPPRAEHRLTPVALRDALAGNDRVALIDGSRQWTGRDLWSRVEAVARGLNERGIGPGDRVALTLAPSSDAVIAIWATLLAGAAFMPIDPSRPAAREQELLAIAGPGLIIESPDDVSALERAGRGSSHGRLVDMSSEPADEAYVLFTSGSRGRPKGVPITHAGLADYVGFAATNYFDPDTPAVAALFTSLTFDLTITTLFAPVLAGGCIKIMAAGAPGVVAVAQDPSITWLKATPSHLELLVEALPPDHGLSTVVVGGEAFGSELAATLYETLPAVEIYNEYGPTEAVVGCMIHKLDPTTVREHPQVSIGRPAPGVELRIVDVHDRRVPAGAGGELLVAHRGITTDYLADPKGVHEPSGRFVELDGRRFYRTGDVVALRGCDDAVFLGRVDDQLKVGGVRTDPLEISGALSQHPVVHRAIVGLFSPTPRPARHRCLRCGLADNVPGTRFDSEGVCDTCRLYERIAPLTESWFGVTDDLVEILDRARSRSSGDYDCLHLLSGGKDSTYALHRLVELGYRPLVASLDNGYLSETAKANIERSVAALDLDHEYLRTDAMPAIFADSLRSHSNVCNGCFKALYTLAINRADELGIAAIVTGLSRGQLFETRLVPEQFEPERFDAGGIDRAVIEARRSYHRAPDAVSRLLDTSVVQRDETFEQIDFVDFYRYEAVELGRVMTYLEQTSWVRPADTGRSTNCLINVAGIDTHLRERGYHNYAVPYAWDVRLGHKTRQEAIAELDDEIDPAEVAEMLGRVGHRPRARSTLTAWVQLQPERDRTPTPTELRSFLADRLPQSSLPTAFVFIDHIPLTPNGKVDTAALEPPTLRHRSAASLPVVATTPTETLVVRSWERLLGLEPIGIDDDFFALGGDSLAALNMIVELSECSGRPLAAELGFAHSTPRSLAAAIDAQDLAPAVPSQSQAAAATQRWATPDGAAPLFSANERLVLADDRLRGGDRQRFTAIFDTPAALDPVAFEKALRVVTARHQPLTWTFGEPRRMLRPDRAIHFEVGHAPCPPSGVADWAPRLHDLIDIWDSGPLLACRVQPTTTGTSLLFATHHVTIDHDGFEVLLSQIDAELSHASPGAQPQRFDHAAVAQAQEWAAKNSDSQRFWLDLARRSSPARWRAVAPERPEPDGYISTGPILGSAELRSVAASPIATALAAAAAAVSDWHDDGELVLSAVTSGRVATGSQQVVANMLAPLPIPITAKADQPLSALLGSVRLAAGAAMAHRGYPLTEILADRRAAGLCDLAPSINVVHFEVGAPGLAGSPITARPAFGGAAQDDLTFFVLIEGDSVSVGLEYDGSAIAAATAQELLARFNRAIVALVRTPQRRVCSIAEPGSTGEPSVLVGPELGTAPRVRDQIIDRLATRSPALAVEAPDRSLTWAELAPVVAELRARLASHGVGSGDRVVVACRPSSELVVALLAVVTCGASYVPVDPDYPRDRVRATLEAAQARLAVVDGAYDLALDTIAIRDPAESKSGPSTPGPSGPPLSLADEAYLIFTSGSTGSPRGVSVSHAALDASNHARAGFYRGAPERFLLLSSIGFDSSIVGLFWTLAAGGSVLIPNNAGDLDQVVGLIAGASPSHMLCVPTKYRELLDRATPVALANWPSTCIVAGEACPAALVDRHHQLAPEAELINEYGPTETTVWATAHRCRPGERQVPIGRPIPGVWVAILGRSGRPAPPGVSGELIIGGATLSGGYVNDHEATHHRFGEGDGTDLPPGRFYRTGDLAHIADETVHFHGRIDDLLNVAGLRIEPLEIESLLSEVAGVEAATVVAQDLRSLGEIVDATDPVTLSQTIRETASERDPAAALATRLTELSPHLEIVAHIEGRAADLDRHDLVEALAGTIPAGSRPRHYFVHDRLPRTPHGKVDRQAALDLPMDRPVKVDARTSEPAEETVELIGTILGESLGSGSLGPDEDFFAVGGHSLIALEALGRLEREFETRLDTSIIYEAPTPRLLAARLSPAGGDHSASQTSLPLRSLVFPLNTEGDRPPIFALFNLGTDGEYIRPLAERLGPNQPFYGLGPVNRVDEYRTDVWQPADVYDPAEIAASYLAEIRRIAPDGPVVLLGICGGVPVAYETAHQMRNEGSEIELLVLVNDWHSPNLAAPPKQDWAQELEIRRQYIASMGLVPYLRQLLPRPFTVAKRRIEIARWKRLESQGRPLPRTLGVRRFIEEGLATLHGYDYRAYGDPVLVLRGADVPLFQVPGADESWDSILDDVAVVEVGGRGILTMQDPHVDGVATAIEARRAELARPWDRHRVEASLIDAVRAGRLDSQIRKLRQLRLSADAAELIDRVAEAIVLIGARARAEAERVAAHLRDHGIDADPAVHPRTMTLPIALVKIAPAAEMAHEALATIGYLPASSGSPTGDFADRESGRRLRLLNDPGGSGFAERPDHGQTTDSLLATPRSLIGPLFEFGALRPGDSIVDLGCGDGRLLAAAADLGAGAVGYETDSSQLSAARTRVGRRERIEVHEADAAEADLTSIDLVFAFLPPSQVDDMVSTALRRVDPGTRIVAHEQAAVAWTVEPCDVALLVSTDAEDPAITIAYRW